ncbi:nicotinamide N-methyltransferase-like [Pelobates cultripes]|uniref:Nicotinamide N-methyltransferase-like n=1 Tax=Pelobates cultripes TaxID=61616 RepID=A0AAD1TB08_PELCU|nr:nicotinamide N-methyltransferase-like [Pelobates cultripes]
MDPSSPKYYLEDNFDPNDLYDIYVGATADKKHMDELLLFPLKVIFSEVKSGRIKGSTLIDISFGPFIFHLLPLCKYFKDITVLEFNEPCLKVLQKWLNKDEDALDWSHAAKIAAELEGNSENWVEKEEDLRRCIKTILPCDFNKQNPTDPVVLAKADCVINLYVLGKISKDSDSYRQNLKIMSSMLKLGGRLLLIGAFKASHYKVSGEKYHVLNFNEEELRTMLKDCGFNIERMEVMESKIRSDVIYYHQMFYVCAVKIKEL